MRLDVWHFLSTGHFFYATVAIICCVFCVAFFGKYCFVVLVVVVILTAQPCKYIFFLCVCVCV